MFWSRLLLKKATPSGFQQLKEIKKQQLEKYIGTQSIHLIDVREPSETAEGMIPTAIPIPLGTLKQKVNQLKEYGIEDTSEPIIVYCKSGKRAQDALEILNKAGYKSVLNYKGSWLDWIKRE